MEKQDKVIKNKINVGFKEYFYSKSRKQTIWRCKDNIPVKKAKFKLKYNYGCDTLSIYLNGSTNPIQILRPGEVYETYMDKLTSVDILCSQDTQTYYSTKRNPCNCRKEEKKEKPCCCSGYLEIITYKPKPQPKPKHDFSFILVLFILLVIIGCTCSNRYYYPIC